MRLHCFWILCWVVCCGAERVRWNKFFDLNNKKCFLFDLDGTIYSVRGGKKALLPGVHEVLSWLNKTGKPWAFVTNTGSKTTMNVQETLKGLGVNAPIEHIITAGEMTAHAVSTATTAYVLGTEAVKSKMRELGVRIMDFSEFSNVEYPEVVVLASSQPDGDWSFAALSAATKFVSRGARFVASAPDLRSMTPDGPIPGGGAFMRLIEDVTGTHATVIGKPEPAMLNEAIRRLNVKVDQCVMVGDNLNTDIRAGINAGMDTVFLSKTGAHSSHDLKRLDIHPTWVSDSLLDFYNNHVLRD